MGDTFSLWLPPCQSKRRCCAARSPQGGRAVSPLRVWCIRSCRQFCSGWAGSISSGRMPKRTHHTESVESRPRAFEAKGAPLSVRIRAGSPVPRQRRDAA